MFIVTAEPILAKTLPTNLFVVCGGKFNYWCRKLLFVKCYHNLKAQAKSYFSNNIMPGSDANTATTMVVILG